MDKKKVLIIVTSILVVLAITITVILIPKQDDKPIDKPVVPNPSVKVTGKLKEYIVGLTNNYYIKYYGEFKNNNGEFVNSILEYTKNGENFGLRSSELDMHMICEKDKLYSISERYKMMILMGRETFDISEYNLVSDINQIYVNSYKEKVNNTEYDVEEYLFKEKVLKYYFNESDIKLIKYDGREIKILRLEKNTNNEMLVKPQDYTVAIV